MNLTIRNRLYVLSIAPLIIISLSLMLLTYFETNKLTDNQMALARDNMMEMKRDELKAFLEIAKTALKPITDANGSLEEASAVLKSIKFSGSGYIFGYDSKGIRVIQGQSDKGVGNSYWDLQDSNGTYLIRELMKNAKTGDFTTYFFPKPGETTPLPKLSYSVFFPQWDLMIGTGFYTDDVDKTIDEMAAASHEQLNSAILNIIIIGLVVVAAVALLAMLVNRSILSPLAMFDKSIKSFAGGDADLTARMPAFSVPEFAELSRNFNQFVESLQVIITNVTSVSEQVVAETTDMSERASKVDSIADGQRSETEQVATAMTEMTTTANDISLNANQAASSAKDADDHTKHANSIVEAAAASVIELASEISNANEVISRLEGDVKNISSLLEVIQDIAEQTNLLALNAAIEAARAGEQGRGFAVVADEVRKLASRTQDSTGEIHKMIEQLKSASDAAVSVMNSSEQRSQGTVEEAKAASVALEQVQEFIHNIMDMNALIATATEEQSIVGQEISERIVVISDQSASSAELANENRSGSSALKEKANELAHLVDRFTV
ncbi:methyl-accepting chemotaxis protein [Vibrio tapetis subsp. quintayensis]|uniref:methyl-accepting chemotaxis protein n=1 Tax=Vibrio tapetis TaxID=52443 RepID=UPI0025B5B5CD|nr:methyl-accepting chemotaxis protein [Vibrio tapetis]MDN3682943.1 methyl-accepting chemotaxis protein [Vibrio tapetis subsp. quintayensis]